MSGKNEKKKITVHKLSYSNIVKSGTIIDSTAISITEAGFTMQYCIQKGGANWAKMFSEKKYQD